MIKKLILRRTPQWANNFVLEKTESADGYNCWSYKQQGTKVLITGDNGVSMAVAYYNFLRDCCGAYFTADHALAVADFNMPESEKGEVINRKFRACLEYTTFSCAACWWSWERWENEIDFMAMNGVNFPLTVVGTEAVWQKTMHEIGMSDEFAVGDVSGPAFWGWQLSNCFDSYIPQVKKTSIDARIALGRKIADREREIGMMPLMHGYSGYLSRNYIKAKLRARMKKAEPWCKFPPQYQVVSRDPSFNRIGTLFMKNQELLLGESDYFLADPFTVHKPLKSGDAFLVGLGTAIYKSITSRNKDAVWVMHSSSAKEPMLRGLPHKKIMIIDNDNDYNENNGFYGCSCIVGTQHNNGDVTAVHGDIENVAGRCFDKIKSDRENLVGVGEFSDGALSNEPFRQLSMAALCGNVDVKKWLIKYAENRYKSSSEKIGEAFNNLCESCWSEGQGRREHASAICTRPSTLLRHSAVGDRGIEPGYDIGRVFKAAKCLSECGGNTYEYELDLCDILRQALSDLGNVLCGAALDGYKEKDVKKFEESTNSFLTLIEDMDRLMMTKKEFALPYHLSCARSAGADADESQNYEINLLSQITIFGPIRNTDLYDCCWKEWGGILKTFYAIRWRAMFEMLAADFKGRRIPEKTRTQIFDRDEYLGSDFGRKLAKVEKEWIAKYDPENDMVGKENTFDVAKELIEKYAPMFKM